MDANNGYCIGGKRKMESSTIISVKRRKTFCFSETMNSHNNNTEEVHQAPAASSMPTQSVEEAELLTMDDVEMHHLQLRFQNSLRVTDDIFNVERVRTNRGDLVVAVSGNRSKPAILTYHDLGLNTTSFRAFFNYMDMRALLENFCVYHVNAPGQEQGAPTLPHNYVYPTMEELARQLNYVLAHFGLNSIIGFGVGAGANTLSKFALLYPEKVEALMLVNCSSTRAGWLEWAQLKMHSRTLRNRGMTDAVLGYLMWHHFGRLAEQRNHDLVTTYRDYFSRHVNPTNLSHFIEAYLRRDDLCIGRAASTIRVPVLNITGSDSPHVYDTVVFNGRLNPNNSTWMKISDCGMVLDEQPGKVSEAFRLFLQGEGYVAPLSPSKMFAYRESGADAGAPSTVGTQAGVRARRACRHSSVMRITENPISEAVVC